MGKCKRTDFIELSKEVLDRGGCLRFRAGGGSMHPFVRDEDVITVSPIENSSIQIGDVVFCSTAGNRVIVHRVINKYKKEDSEPIVIKGDACFGSPERVNAQDVLGKVVAIERNGREKRLDTTLCRLTGLLLAGMSPFSHWIYPVGSIVKHSGRRLLAFGGYKSLKRTNHLKKPGKNRAAKSS